MLGSFGALGQLALGELRKDRFSFFGQWSQPQSVKNSSVLAPSVSFAIAPTVRTTSVFSSFSQPSFKPVIPTPDVNFRILRPDAATTGPLVFTRFSEPYFPKTVSVDKHTSPIFRTLRPDAATTGPLVFTKFSEPSKVTFKNSDVVNTPVVTTVVVAPTIGGDFADFDLVKSRPAIQYGFTNAPIVLAAQPYVFSKFSEPSKTTFKNSDATNVPVFITPTVVVQPYVFGTFSQPSPKVVPLPDKLFVGDRGPAQTPTWSTFPPFKELLTKKPQQDPSIGFIGDRGPAQNPLYLSFSDFEGIPPRRPLEGYITSASPPAVQNYVFSRFDQPVYKRILHPDQSFVNFPAVIAAVQPYLFSDFGQPQQTKRPIIDDRSFLNFPIVVAQQQPYVFSDFGQPQYKAVLKEGQVTFNGSLGPAIVPPWFVFGQANQPQLIRPRVDGFTNTPGFLPVQPYVFGQFDQPRQLIRVVPGFTNNQTFIAPQSYVFSRFEQPFRQKTLQIDSVQFVGNTPTVVVLTPDFSYSDFGLPFYVKQSGISFTNSPLQPIVALDNSAPFSGFTSFVIQLPGQYHIEQHPGVVYEILVPDVLVEDVIAGKRWKVQTRESPKTVPVVSSHISEVTFDKDSNELNVKFNNGSVYNYANVDSKKAKGLVRAKSSGKYLHNNIKGKYFTTRIK